MEIPKHWRTKAQRLRLEGFIIKNKNGVVTYEFPPKADKNKSGFLLPNNQVIHGVVVRKDQEKYDEGKN